MKLTKYRIKTILLTIFFLSLFDLERDRRKKFAYMIFIIQNILNLIINFFLLSIVYFKLTPNT